MSLASERPQIHRASLHLQPHGRLLFHMRLHGLRGEPNQQPRLVFPLDHLPQRSHQVGDLGDLGTFRQTLDVFLRHVQGDEVRIQLVHIGIAVDDPQIEPQIAHDPHGSQLQFGQVLVGFLLHRQQFPVRFRAHGRQCRGRLPLHRRQPLVRLAAISIQQRGTGHKQRGRHHQRYQAEKHIHAAVPQLRPQQPESRHDRLPEKA